MVMKILRWSAIAILVALGSWGVMWLPTADRATQTPFERPGQLGQWVKLRTGEVKVTGVELTTEVHVLGNVVTTEDLWLVVHLQVQPSSEPLALPPLLLKDASGRTFGDDVMLRGTCRQAQPGLITTCSQLLEIPADALPGARLWIPATTDASRVPDDVAVIDLNLDITSATQRVEVQDSLVTGTP